MQGGGRAGLLGPAMARKEERARRVPESKAGRASSRRVRTRRVPDRVAVAIAPGANADLPLTTRCPSTPNLLSGKLLRGKDEKRQSAFFRPAALPPDHRRRGWRRTRQPGPAADRGRGGCSGAEEVGRNHRRRGRRQRVRRPGRGHRGARREFLALDPQEGVLRLDAAWNFSCTGRDRRGRAGRTSLEVPLASPTPAAVASATADALGRLADVLAAQAECDRREAAGGEMTWQPSKRDRMPTFR
jgi:hypothetical protein